MNRLLKMLHLKNKKLVIFTSFSIIFLGVLRTLANPVFENPKSSQEYSTISQKQCLKTIEKIVSGNKISEKEIILAKRCRTKYLLSNSNISLPTLTECINVFSLSFDAFNRNSLTELTAISEVQQQLLSRCSEVIEARYVASGAMNPNVQIKDYLLISKIDYISHEPKRGDIISFKPTHILKEQGFKDDFIERQQILNTSNSLNSQEKEAMLTFFENAKPVCEYIKNKSLISK